MKTKNDVAVNEVNVINGKKVQNLSTDERNANEKKYMICKDVFANCYQYLTDVCEIEMLQTTVKISDLRKYTKVSEILAKVDEKNKQTEILNFDEIKRAFEKFVNEYTFASKREKMLFLLTVRKRYNLTKNFSVTYQAERTDETDNIYENGAYFSRPTSFTVAGVRTSFNSVDLIRTALNNAKKRAFNDKYLPQLAQLMGISVETVATLPPATVKQMINLYGLK